MTTEIHVATDRDVLDALRFTREEDKREAYLSTGLGFCDALELTMGLSSKVLAGRHDNKLIALFGVIPSAPLQAQGQPWLVATPEAQLHWRAFTRNSRYALAELEDGFLRMENYVAEFNTDAKRWLVWLGFEVEKAQPVAPFGEPFHRFHKEVS